MSDQKRNLNPHKPARAAMYLFGERYSQQGGGSMDFWDRLSESDKILCRRLVDDLKRCPEEDVERIREICDEL